MNQTEINTTVDYNITIYRNSNFLDPLVLIPFLWMTLCLLVNFGVALDALTGWLISPKITKLVLSTCSLCVCWMIMYILQSYIITNRPITVIATWLGLALTLLTALQHVELLKLFSCLSDYWTIKKCIIYQKVLCAVHILFASGCYAWPVGLETNAIATQVQKYLLDLRILLYNMVSYCHLFKLFLRIHFAQFDVEAFARCPTRNYNQITNESVQESNYIYHGACSI